MLPGRLLYLSTPIRKRYHSEPSLSRAEIVAKFLQRVFSRLAELSSFQWTTPEEAHRLILLVNKRLRM
jgi:hypothetical protein